MVRVLVCGDRNWKNKAVIEREIKALIAQTLPFDEDGFGEFVLIEGEANGADLLSRQVVEELNPHRLPYIPKVLPFAAKWDKYGNAAGPIRNQRMLDEGKPDIVLAFHNNIKSSKGTLDMIDKALKAGIPVRIFGA